MESVLVKVVSFIAVIVVGYLLKRVGFFRSEDFRLIAGLVLKVTLPCAIISNFTRIDVDAALFVLVLLGLGCNLVTVAAGCKGKNVRSLIHAMRKDLNFSSV